MMPEDDGPTYDPLRSSVEKVHEELNALAATPQEELMQHPAGPIVAMAAPALPMLAGMVPQDPQELDAQLAGGAAFLLSLRSDDAPPPFEEAPGEVNGHAEEAPELPPAA